MSPIKGIAGGIGALVLLVLTLSSCTQIDTGNVVLSQQWVR